VVSQLVLAIGGVIATRHLGPDGRGVVTAVLTWSQTLPFVALAGLNLSLTVRVAGRVEEVPAALGSALLYTMVVGGVLLVGSLVVLPPMIERLDPDGETLMAVALTMCPVAILTELLFGILVGINRLRQYNICRLLGPAIVLAGTVALAAADHITPFGIVLLNVAASAATAGCAALRLPWRRLAVMMGRLAADLRFGTKVAVASWLAYANLRLDVLVMSAVVSATQIGYYGVANNAMLPVTALASAAAGLLTPAVAGLTASTDPARTAHSQVALIRDELRRYLVLAVAGAAVLAAGAPVFVPLLFGDAFRPAVTLTWILIPGFVARVCASLVTAGAVGMRRPRIGVMIEGSAVVVTALLLPILLPRHEAIGAAVTSTTAYVVAGLTAIVLLRRLHDTSTGGHPASPVSYDVALTRVSAEARDVA
jgi:O-antigen/teichoic acid export membrane protein